MLFDPRDIRLVVFDFDGVLADSGADIAAAIRAAQRRYGQKMWSKKDILSHVGHGAVKLVEGIFIHMDKDRIPEVVSWYNEYYKEHSTVYTKLYPGVREFLELLKEKSIAACVVTNKPEFLADKILTELGVREYFALVIGPESLNNMKPDPEGIEYCMRYTETGPGETVMVGDSDSDIQAGKNAGVHTCGVLYGIGDREKMLAEGPECTVKERLEEMFEKKDNK